MTNLETSRKILSIVTDSWKTEYDDGELYQFSDHRFHIQISLNGDSNRLFYDEKEIMNDDIKILQFISK